MNILDRIEDLLIAILDLADFVRLYGNRQIRRLLRTELILTLILLISFLSGAIMGWEILVVTSAFFTSILGLAIWKQTEIVVIALLKISGVKPEIDNKIFKFLLKPATEAIELSTEAAEKAAKLTSEILSKTLTPILITSMGISFLANYIALKGLDYFSTKDLIIYSTVILFIAIFFWAYLETKKKWAGKVMFIWLLWLIASIYLWPIQCQELLETVENTTVNWAMEMASGSRNKKIVDIPAGTPLYQFDHGNIKLVRTAGKDIKAKIIGRKKDFDTGETLYQVILPTQKDIYVGGEKVYVPASMARLTIKPPAKLASNQQSVIELKKGDKRLYEISDEGYSSRIFVPDGVRYDFISTGGKPFEVVFDDGQRVVLTPGGPYVNIPTVDPCIFRVYSKEKQGIMIVGN